MNFSLRERVTWKGITGMVSYIDPCGGYFHLKAPAAPGHDYPLIVVFEKYFDEVETQMERRRDNIS